MKACTSVHAALIAAGGKDGGGLRYGMLADACTAGVGTNEGMHERARSIDSCRREGWWGFEVRHVG